MEWIKDYLPLILSSGAILIVLFILKRALDWAEWKGSTETFRTSVEDTLKKIGEDIKEIREDIKKMIERLPPPAASK